MRHFSLVSGLFLLKFASAVSVAFAASATPPIFDDYESFYATVPDALFTVSDARPLLKGVTRQGRTGLRWVGVVEGSSKRHQVEIDGADMSIDGRHLERRQERSFEGESASDIGDRATLYVRDGFACLESQPASASGTSQRHVQVTLITAAFSGGKAARFQLPSLFGSCLAVQRDAEGQLLFFKASYRWAEAQAMPIGVDFNSYKLSKGQFKATGIVLSARFVEAGNVYRFTRPEPADPSN